jgi:hypothetical protein
MTKKMGRPLKPGPRLDDITVERIWLHYKRLGISNGRSSRIGWNWDRFNRLCQMLHCTQRELAALCCIPEAQLTKWHNEMLNGRHIFPPYASLHFALIEAAYLEATGQCYSVAVMPFGLLQVTKAPGHD